MTQSITSENINQYLDQNGYLNNIDLWNIDIAKILAKLNNINLTNDHIIIINAIRNFYIEYNTYPILRVFIKKLKQDNLLEENKYNSIYLNKLFPETPIPLAGKLAGLPKSKKCIKF
tara:strand:- start:15359 stop:15709 length:351 start_codon:yes stop_codon:yes gene_type:complete